MGLLAQMSSDPAAGSGAAPQPIDLTPGQLASLTAVMLLAFTGSLGMPFNIDAIALSFGASNTTAGMVASAEMAAIAAGNLLFARLAPRMPPRQVYVRGVLIIVAANLLSALVTGTVGLIGCRMVAGFALGAVVATVMSTAGRSRKPEVTFGVINSMVGAMGIVIAYLLPRALSMHQFLPGVVAWSAADGLYLVYLLCAALALYFVRGTPLARPAALERAAGADAPRLLIGWLALLGLGVIFSGHASLGLFIVTIGRQVPLSPEAVGYVLMAGSLAAVGAPLLAGFLAQRVAALWPITLILLALALAAVGMANARTPLQFYVAAPLFAMLPVAIMPIFLGALARLDPSGSLTGAHPAFVLVGVALAPFAGGLLSDLGGFVLNGWFVVGCVALGAGLGSPAVRRADRRRSSARAVHAASFATEKNHV
jgi:predicted MFS family arabinose efflux permease